MKTVLIGVIGGSGLGQMLGDLGQGESLTVDTPFGAPFRATEKGTCSIRREFPIGPTSSL